jgi:hypothetical protein
VVGVVIALVGALSAVVSPTVSLGLQSIGYSIDPVLTAVLLMASAAFLGSQALIVGRFGSQAAAPVRVSPVDWVWLLVPGVLVVVVTGWTLLRI